MSAIHDVAKRAGIAPITVSRVDNNKGNVSDETRRVEAAIVELNNIPNARGSSLRSKRTQTLALVLSDITNPFWTTVAKGVEDAANKQGYHIIIGNTDESPEKEEEYLVFLLKKQVDGFLLVPASSRSSSILQLRKAPFVAIDRRISGENVDSVRCDSVGGAYALTKHLIELGHRHIAIITAHRDHSTAYDRVAGFFRAYEDAELDDTHQVYWGEYNQQTGYNCTQQIIKTHPRPTAIFATNNFIAIGAMRALQDAKVRVPRDMSLVAFDDLPSAITINPFLSVAAQPAYEMGKIATEMLLSRLADDGPEHYQEIVLPIEVIIRKSSAKPPIERR